MTAATLSTAVKIMVIALIRRSVLHMSRSRQGIARSRHQIPVPRSLLQTFSLSAKRISPTSGTRCSALLSPCTLPGPRPLPFARLTAAGKCLFPSVSLCLRLRLCLCDSVPVSLFVCLCSVSKLPAWKAQRRKRSVRSHPTACARARKCHIQEKIQCYARERKFHTSMSM